VWKRLRDLFRQAIREQSEAWRIGLALGLGAVSGMAPLPGLQTFLALGLATVFRCNRLAAFAGSNVSFGPLMAVIVTTELSLGSWLLRKPRPPLDTKHMWQMAGDVLGQCLLGYAILGPLVAVIVGYTGYIFARRYQQSNRAPEAENPTNSVV
jgi:uncharacterized protein (DUF2062 family)